MAVWTGYAQNGQGNYMSGNTTKISQLMFKAMMEAFGTDTANFQQPESVYRVNNELYIKGIDSAEVPPKNDNVIIHPNNGGNKKKAREKIQKRGREIKKRGREASKRKRKKTKAWLDRYFFLTIVPLQ